MLFRSEINRNFRNEGIDRSHNPEFTAMEAYEAFGDYMTMLEMVESLVHHVACAMAGCAGCCGGSSRPSAACAPPSAASCGWSRPAAPPRRRPRRCGRSAICSATRRR